MGQVDAAQRDAVALLRSVDVDPDVCADLAADLALGPVAHQVLVAFVLVEVAVSGAPADAASGHPVHGPALSALRAGDAERVRAVLREAFSGRTRDVYARLLVQLALVTATLVADLDATLVRYGLEAADGRAGDRDAGTLPQ